VINSPITVSIFKFKNNPKTITQITIRKIISVKSSPNQVSSIKLHQYKNLLTLTFDTTKIILLVAYKKNKKIQIMFRKRWEKSFFKVGLC